MTPTRPQPVLTAGLAAQAVSVLAFIVGGFGIVLTDDQQGALTAGILGVAGLISVIAHLVAMFRARAQVTPIADPVAADGTPLVPITELVLPAQAQAYAGDEKVAAALHYDEAGPDDFDDDTVDDEALAQVQG